MFDTEIHVQHPDPHVKVEGWRANVTEAKKKILDMLETKVNTVSKTQIHACTFSNKQK